MTNIGASGHKYAFKVKKNFWIGTPFCKNKKNLSIKLSSTFASN